MLAAAVEQGARAVAYVGEPNSAVGRAVARRFSRDVQLLPTTGDAAGLIASGIELVVVTLAQSAWTDEGRTSEHDLLFGVVPAVARIAAPLVVVVVREAGQQRLRAADVDRALGA